MRTRVANRGRRAPSPTRESAWTGSADGETPTGLTRCTDHEPRAVLRMIRATVIAGSPPNAHSFGQYDFAALPAKGDTIVVHGAHDAEVVRVVHTEHFPATVNPRL